MHNNQIIAISKSAKIQIDLKSLEDFKRVEFKDWDFFYHHDSLIKNGISKNGIEFLVFGICENLNGENEAVFVIENCNSEAELISSSYFFSGRYFIFFGGSFYPDACGHLQLFYNSSLNIVSSSLGLFEIFKGNTVCPLRYREFKKLGFFPAPQTIYQDIYLLLSNQKIKDGGVVYSEKKPIKYYENYKTQFIDTTRFFIKKLNKKYKLVLPLTGGIDSRTILAFLLDTKAQIFAYTSLYFGILNHDVFIPKLLSIIYNFKYNWIIGNKNDQLSKRKKHLSSFIRHTGYNAIDKDKLFYTHSLYPKFNDLGKRLVMLRGAGWAVFRGFYLRDLPLCVHDNERISSLKLLFKQLDDCPFAVKALQNWLEGSFFFRNDWRIQFYIDQRVNAWDGPLEQAICLTNFEPTLIMNSEFQIDLLNSWFQNECDKIEGRTQIIQKEIINDLKPSLNLFPYNFSKHKVIKKVILKAKYFFKK
jgi:hypothetical protein